MSRDEVDDDIYISPITDYVEVQLGVRLRLLEPRAQVQMYKQFSSIPGARGMTLILFEAYCQVRFRGKIQLQFVPMVRLSDPLTASQATKKRKGSGSTAHPRRAPRPQWHSSHNTLSNEELERKRQNALLSKASINIRPSSVFEYDGDDFPSEIRSNVYYLPKKSNQVTLDSFILHLGILYIFQFTTAKEHLIKDGLLSFLARCTGLPPQDGVIPDDVDLLKCPVPQPCWN
jgi:hypothetical protein